MAHIKRFEEFRADKGTTVNELFNSKAKAAELEKAKAAFDGKIKEYQGKNFEVDEEGLRKKAEANKYRGELKAIKSAKSGKIIVIYKDGLTNLQKIASGTGSMTRGENLDVSEEADMDEMESEEGTEGTTDSMDEMDEEFEEYDCDEYENDMDSEEEEEEDEIEEFDFDEDEDIANVMERYNKVNEGKDLAEAQAEIEKQMDELAAKNYVVNKEVLLKQAKENKFRGNLKPVKSAKSGKIMVIYQPGLSKLQKLASGSGAMTVGK